MSHPRYRCRHRRARRGLTALEAVVALMIGMPIGAGAFMLGLKACRHLYHFMSTMVGSPYL